METLKPNFSICGRTAAHAVLRLVALSFIVPLNAGESLIYSDLAGKEQARRTASVDEAQELLHKGDEAYTSGRYSEAVEAYAGARDLFPDAPVSAQLRAAATQRYAQASIEHARFLSQKGDVAGAKAVMDRVLREGGAPNDPDALAFRRQLDDPIRVNPALTTEHAQNVDLVRRKLYIAEGHFSLGQFDECLSVYQDVLRLDPTNSAARRGMERVASAKSEYQASSYDQTRAQMLSDVDAGWEMAVPPAELESGFSPLAPEAGPSVTVNLATKLERIIIPSLALQQATLEEALDLLRVRAVECDTFELEPTRRGVNFTLNLGAVDSEVSKRIRNQRFDLRLSQVPIYQAIKYLTDITQTSFSVDEFAVIISPAGTTSDELVARSYRVPPDFLTTIGSGLQGGGQNDDPFAEAPEKQGLLAKRLSAQEALAKQGISFPNGASANYSAGTNTLRVVNTKGNQDAIGQIVESMAQTEPVLVSVTVTMIKTQQTNLEELGFDTLISPFAANGSESVFAAGGSVGNTPGRASSEFTSPINGVPISGVSTDPTAVVSSGVLTNGLRSGDSATHENSLDGLINDPSRGAQQQYAAPGIMSVTGLFTDGQVQTIMRGLDQKKSVDVMARPSTVTRSGQSTTVMMVREFPYATEYEPPELPSNVGSGGTSPVTPAHPTSFEKKDVGISLDVLAVADANKKYIDITLNPSFSDFDGFVNYGSPINSSVQGLLGPQVVELTENAILMPIFSNQKLATQLTIADGATIAIGGLMSESIQNVNDSVPVFSSIPLLGRLFKSEARKPVSMAVIFLVHVELMDPTGRPYRDR